MKGRMTDATAPSHGFDVSRWTHSFRDRAPRTTQDADAKYRGILMTHKRSKYGPGTFQLSIFILLGCLSMTNTRALELDMTEALVDLLGHTSFDAAGSHKNYNRLLLWDYGSEVNLFVDQDVDGIDHDWVAGNVAEIMAIFDPNSSIRFNMVADPFDAHIIIVSAKNKSRLEDRNFYDFLRKKYKMNRNDFRYFTNRMNQLYSTSSYAWGWPQIVDEPATGTKRITGFLAVIESKEKFFRLSFSKMIFHALGYGNGSYMFSKILSVQTHANYKTYGIEGVDFLIMRFLYNSQARNGMEKAFALRLFRNWMKSEEFKKLNTKFIKYQ